MEHALWMTLLTWAVMTVRLSTPLLYTALGGMFGQKGGIFNFALEGCMLFGAFFAYVGSSTWQSPWLGLIFAVAMGMIIGVMYAFTAVHLAVNQMVIGLGINIFSLGITGYFYRLIDTTAVAPMMKELRIPLLSKIPVLGPILFSHSILVYLGLGIVVLLYVFLQKTNWGINLRAVGENPKAADSLGISVVGYRYFAMIVSCGLASAGGAYLTLTQVSRFLENMIEGRGWIALAAIILGKYRPRSVLVACLIFGGADALAMQFQIIGISVPYQVLQMIPYVVTMLVLAGVVGDVRGPAALAKPYIK